MTNLKNFIYYFIYWGFCIGLTIVLVWVFFNRTELGIAVILYSMYCSLNLITTTDHNLTILTQTDLKTDEVL